MFEVSQARHSVHLKTPLIQQNRNISFAFEIHPIDLQICDFISLSFNQRTRNREKLVHTKCLSV